MPLLNDLGLKIRVIEFLFRKYYAILYIERSRIILAHRLFISLTLKHRNGDIDVSE